MNFFYQIILFISFLFTNNLLANEKILISENSILKLQGYIKGRFWSERYNNNISNVSGLYFYLSKDGQYSSISFCPDFIPENCVINHENFRAKFSCEKISNQSCKMIFKKNKFIPTGKKIEDIDQSFKNSNFIKVKNNDSKNQLFTIDNKAITFEEQSSNNGWE